MWLLAFTAAVLPGMPGFGGFNADTEPSATKLKAWRGERLLGSERNAVVGTDGLFQPTPSERVLKAVKVSLFGVRFHWIRTAADSGGLIGDGEQVAVPLCPRASHASWRHDWYHNSARTSVHAA